MGWKRGSEVIYCLEGSVFVAGAVVQWMRDGLRTIVGLTRDSRIGHIARAAVESMAYQSRDVLDAMQRDARYRRWQRAVERSRDWERP